MKYDETTDKEYVESENVEEPASLHDMLASMDIGNIIDSDDDDDVEIQESENFGTDDIARMQELIPLVIENLKECGQLDSYVKLV